MLLAAAAAMTMVACKGSPASPFDRLKDSPITVYRLQNFEPQPQAAAPAMGTPGGTSLIPGLPPEIQNWVQQGASGLGALLPPGLIPPGLIPGVGTPGAMPTAQPDAPRFEGFRILGQAQVMDSKLREQIIDIFGYDSSFAAKKSPCLYPEVGISFTQVPQPPADVLVSFSCNQAQGRNFTWPHKDNGLTEDTSKKLVRITQSLFGGG
jgi:hypothetical protein